MAQPWTAVCCVCNALLSTVVIMEPICRCRNLPSAWSLGTALVLCFVLAFLQKERDIKKAR